MTTIGLIGAGNIGSTVARLAVAAGHDVILSNSPGPETLADLVAELGPRARAATPAEAAQADTVVVTIPLRNIEQLPVAALAGKTVIDTNNYYPERDGAIPTLDDGSTTTARLLQDLLRESQVVKAFNNIHFRHLQTLARPRGSADRSALPIAGDSNAAKATAASLIDDLGFDVVDAGTLDESWRFERDRPVYGIPYIGDPAGWQTGARPEVARTAPAAEIRRLLDEPGPRVL